MKESEHLQEHSNATQFWTTALGDFDAPTPLMIDDVTQPQRGDRARYEYLTNVDSKLDPDFWRGVFALLLGRYNNEESVLFGELGSSVVRPVRAQMSWDEGFSDWAAALADWQRESRKFDLSDLTKLQREYSAVPCETQMLSSVLVTRPDSNLPDGFPLAVQINDGKFVVDYDSGRFSKSSVARLASHLETLAANLSADPRTSLRTARMLPEEEYTTVIDGWNKTKVSFPDTKTLHELFEEQVVLRPDAPAVTYEESTLTYKQLNERANKIAARLIEMGVRVDSPVAISLSRGHDMVAAMVGIVKAGGGYMPLDPGYPEDRLQYMVEDSESDVLITESSLLGIYSASKADILVIDEDTRLGEMPTENPNRQISPTDLAYLIYTSGSTGNPKGVLVDHRGRVNNFCDFNRRYDVGPDDRVLALSSMSFDMCAYDVFGTLAAGAEIVVGESGSDLDPRTWAKQMTSHQITVWHSVPALLEMVVDVVESQGEMHPKDLRLVLLGGDWIPVTLPDRIKAIGANDIRVISMGGATEVSMDSTIYEVLETDAKWKSIPYGAPMWNQRAYVLDKEMQPMPIGVPGELFLGGIGVGRGYHNRPNLTAEKFLANPFVPGEMIYRTGDLCRWRDDGNLQILGRMDFQVKIRGFRIELGEIESALREHPAVHETVVMANDTKGGEKRLVAYVVREESANDSGASDGEEAVAKWAAVFDAAYDVPGVGDADPTFKITSWDSSYTGEPYPESDVSVWVDTTVERILSFEPHRVLEIGCGTGLLLFRIAPNCESYVGIDTSKVAIDHVQLHSDRLGFENVQVSIGDAAKCGEFGSAKFDMVVINSVAQNFPNGEYFLEVVEQALKVLEPGGVLFLGDMRDKVSERILQSSISLARAPQKWVGSEILSHADRQIDRQEELIVDPRLFFALKQRFDEIAHAEVELRRGECDDEMTKFRYNVILRKEEKPSVPEVDEIVDYSDDQIDELLAKSDSACIVVRRIPNGRVFAEAAVLAMMAGDGASLGRDELTSRMEDIRRSTPSSPHQFEQRVAALGFNCSCRFSVDGDRQYFDAVLYRSDSAQKYLPDTEQESGGQLSSYFNVPFYEAKSPTLTPELRRHLEQKLPYYMVPSSFVFLDSFPLSPNGKVNRRALPAPDNVRPELDVEFVEPSSDLEQVLGLIWTDALGIDRIGMNDPFVAVGGSSLLATQLVTRIREVFQLQLSIKVCLNGSLAEVRDELLALADESDVEIVDIAEMYLRVFQLSADELEDEIQRIDS